MPCISPQCGLVLLILFLPWKINGGEKADSSSHWAYRELNDSQPPLVKDESWVRNPIDRFVLARLERRGIQPSPPAERTTLIKRLCYDLIGLPPTPEEVDSFLSDTSPGAYEKLVNRLLASSHFGERWGRHWLDKARYADSDGYEKDNPRPNAWHYRDWVIRAVNQDMPIDRFTIEQLAGDLLPNPTSEQKLATAFHRQTLTNTEGGTDPEEFRVEAVFDRTETTGTIWLGLTMQCARCHDHKYDSISQEEYYQLYAFFNSGAESTFNLPNSETAMARFEKEQLEHENRLEQLDNRIAEAKREHETARQKWAEQLQSQLQAMDPPRFHDLKDLQVTSPTEGIRFSIEEAGVVHVSGVNPDGGIIYQVSASTPSLNKPVTALRLDALTDQRLPQNGPGRADNGNFVLNEVELFLGENKLEFNDAAADFSQDGFHVRKLVDPSTARKSGWAIGPQTGQPHHAILKLKEPDRLEANATLKIKLIRNYDGGHSLGRFRVRLMTGTSADDIAPKEIRDILAIDPSDRTDKLERQLTDFFLKNVYPPTRELFAKRADLVKQAPEEPVTPVNVISRRRRDTHILNRGNFLSPTERVEPSGLDVLPSMQQSNKAESLDRLDLARWLMSNQNPLTPRVLANHVWEKLFGEGLVRTLNDFGVRGDPPTHPDLLDWLAAEYRRLGWSRKQFIKTIVTSTTYRQSSAHRPELSEIDPQNRLLARQNRFRVEAEIVRDLCLSVSGLLSHKIGGPSVFPPMPEEVAALSYANNFKWNTSKEEDRYRRGMYTFFKRTAPHPNLVTFDCPDSNTTRVQRRTSNTPLQALTMLNNEVFVEASQALAKRALDWKPMADSDRVTKMLRLCIARHPGEEELRSFLKLLDTSRTYYREHPEEARRIGEKYPPEGVDPVETASWVAVARIALNLDELITRE